MALNNASFSPPFNYPSCPSSGLGSTVALSIMFIGIGSELISAFELLSKVSITGEMGWDLQAVVVTLIDFTINPKDACIAASIDLRPQLRKKKDKSGFV